MNRDISSKWSDNWFSGQYCINPDNFDNLGEVCEVIQMHYTN